MTEQTAENPSGNSSPADETVVEESFAELFEKSLQPPERFVPGQKIRTRVINISGDLVYIDIAGKNDGAIDLNEFKNSEGVPVVREGEELDAFFVTVQDGIRKFTTLVRGYSTVNLSALKAAFEGNVPVNGDVKREVKGGYEVTVSGIRCFCPFSQIDMKGGREGGVYLGQTFSFKVLEFKDDGRSVILSRRAVLEQKRREQIAQLRESLTVGMDVTGPVSSLQSFGAFVDLNGIEGLIPLSEMAYYRVEKSSDLLSLGQEVTARIIALDWDSNKITLSLKALQPDPWASAAERYVPEHQVRGTVVRLTSFGAFVSLEPGIDGLIHISNLGAGRRVNHPREVLEAGQVVDAYVLSVDPDNRRISLSLQPKPVPKPKTKPQARIPDLPDEGALVSGVVEKVMPFGVFVKMESGVTGLIPNSEMGTPKGSDHGKMFPAGASVQAVVLEADKKTGKVSLSRKGILDREELEEYASYKQQNEIANSRHVGTFGEKLLEIMKGTGLR